LFFQHSKNNKEDTMSRITTTCALIFLFVCPAVAQIQVETLQGLPVTAREVVIQLRSPARLPLIAQQQDIEVSRSIGSNGAVLLRSRSKSAGELITNLAADQDVVFVEPNYVVQAVLTPNDPNFNLLWGLKNNNVPGADINAAAAWDVTTGSTANVVGVVDTGVLYTHPDLAANMWSAPTSFTVTFGAQQITCAAGTHGFRVINGARSCAPVDDHFHGTHVSGTIGAVGNNNQGVVGVNWTASIMALKFLSSSGSGSIADAIDVIAFARQAKQIFGAQANVRVLNNSWGGGGFSQAMLNEINAANQADMLFVAAAGNDNANNNLIPFYPANYNAPNVVSVAATTITDARSSFSNYGSSTVHLGAPGSNVYSTTLNNSYTYASGTSMASPHVAGAAALILSVCNLNTAGLKANILNNVDPIASMAGMTITGGRLDVNNSIQACKGNGPPDFTISATPPSQTIRVGENTSYTISISPTNGFNGTVNLSLSLLPAGITGSFASNMIFGGSGSTTLNIQTTAAASPGTYPLTVTGTNGNLVHSFNVQLVLTDANFSMSASPSSQTIVPGAGTSYAVTLTRTGGFAASVAFSVSGLPANATGTFSPPATLGTSTTLNITTNGNVAPGTYNLTLTGTGGGLTRTANVTLTIQSFTMTASPSSRTIPIGGFTTFSMQLTRMGGFAEPVVFDVFGMPLNALNGFFPPIITGDTTTLVIVAGPTVAPGVYPMTVIAGVPGGLVRTANVTLTVQSISVAVSPFSRSIIKGGSTTYSVTVIDRDTLDHRSRHVERDSLVADYRTRREHDILHQYRA